MTKKAVLIAISRNVVWKETAIRLKHYRIKFISDLDQYNKYAWTLISLYRNIENEIKNESVRYTKFQYRDILKQKIKELEKGK